MTPTEFKDLAAGFQSIAIVVATLLGGSWALFQFFSLRALDKAKLEIDRMKKELVQRGVLVVELATETFEIEESYFLHVRVAIRNVGTGFDVIDWTKANMFATKFHKEGEAKLATDGQLLLAWRAPSLALRDMRLMPGSSTSESFLISIPKMGVYYIEFGIPASAAVKAETIFDLEMSGGKTNSEDVVIWRADKFVKVPSSPLATTSALTH